MRISDWSSDVCSSDLVQRAHLFILGIRLHAAMDEANAHARKFRAQLGGGSFGGLGIEFVGFLDQRADPIGLTLLPTRFGEDRKSVVSGKSVSVSVDLSGTRIINKKNNNSF